MRHKSASSRAAPREFCVTPQNQLFFWRRIIRSSTVYPRSVAAATINLLHGSAAPFRGRRLFEGAAFILPAGLPPFPATPPVLMWTLSSASRALTCARDGWPWARDCPVLLFSDSWPSCLPGDTSAHAHCNCSCGYCSRAATITLSLCSVRRLFEGGVYSGCGVYSMKYGSYSYSSLLLTLTHFWFPELHRTIATQIPKLGYNQ